MEIVKYNIPTIPDNDLHYFRLLEGVLESIDPYSILSITRSPGNYSFKLSPSLPVFINPIIEQLIILHNLFGIQLDFSKSIKTAHTISFAIDIN